LTAQTAILTEDLGRLSYDAAYQIQCDRHQQVLAWRDTDAPTLGVILAVEHHPVITVSRRAAASSHVLASPATLDRAGVTLRETDRGGDVTYHGPGQAVLYPILDLNRLRLGLHDYMRLLEQSVIDACATWGVRGEREAGATGVWVNGEKLCAFGVRVRRWISTHGLALNVNPDLGHFGLIVPCGLAGRSVTSLRRLMGNNHPSMAQTTSTLTATLKSRLEARIAEITSRQREDSPPPPRPAT
jgi:lipoate-protein ligase B